MDSLFQDDNSESSVSLTSTVESELQEEYLIDRILAERPRSDEGQDQDDDALEYLGAKTLCRNNLYTLD